MDLTKIEVACPSAPLCPECEQHTFADSDRGTVFCPQCRSRFLIRVDPTSGITTLSYFVNASTSWGEHAQPPRLKKGAYGATFDPTHIADPTIRLLLCGTPIDPASIIPDSPDLLRCSFCGDEVSHARASYGKKPYVVFSEVASEDDDGQLIIERLKQHRQSNVVACPQCVLKITPSTTKEVCPTCAGMKVISGRPCMTCLQPRKRGKTTVMIPTGKVDGAVRSNLRWISPEEM